MFDFDVIVWAYCRERNIMFTRYADDLTFSGNEFDSKQLIQFVTTELRRKSLELKSEKTKMMDSGKRQIITGIVVNEVLQTPKKYRNDIRCEIYFLKKFGLDSYRQKLNCNRSNYLQHLLGKVNFVLMVKPSDKKFIEYKRFLYKMMSKEGLVS